MTKIQSISSGAGVGLATLAIACVITALVGKILSNQPQKFLKVGVVISGLSSVACGTVTTVGLWALGKKRTDSSRAPSGTHAALSSNRADLQNSAPPLSWHIERTALSLLQGDDRLEDQELFLTAHHQIPILINAKPNSLFNFSAPRADEGPIAQRRVRATYAAAGVNASHFAVAMEGSFLSILDLDTKEKAYFQGTEQAGLRDLPTHLMKTPDGKIWVAGTSDIDLTDIGGCHIHHLSYGELQTQRVQTLHASTMNGIEEWHLRHINEGVVFRLNRADVRVQGLFYTNGTPYVIVDDGNRLSVFDMQTGQEHVTTLPQSWKRRDCVWNGRLWATGTSYDLLQAGPMDAEQHHRVVTMGGESLLVSWNDGNNKIILRTTSGSVKQHALDCNLSDRTEIVSSGPDQIAISDGAQIHLFSLRENRVVETVDIFEDGVVIDRLLSTTDAQGQPIVVAIGGGQIALCRRG